MEKAKIIIRLDLISYCDNTVELLKSLKSIPEPKYFFVKGKKRILADGREMPTPNERSIFNFEYEFYDFDVENCNEKIKSMWEKHIDTLNFIINKFKLSIKINYQITVTSNDFPSLIFADNYISFLASIKAELSFYFYNDLD